MNSSVMVDSIMFATAGCDSAPGPKASSPALAGEFKRAFADTPPLAEIRKASESKEISSSEVSLEGEMDHEQAIGFQGCPSEESASPQTAEAPAEGEPTGVQSDPMAAPTAVLTGEAPAMQGDLAATLPSQDMVVNAEGVPAEAIIGREDATPGWSMATDSVVQSVANPNAAANMEGSDAGLALTRAEMPSAPTESPVVTSEMTTLPQGNGGGEMPLTEADAAIGEMVRGDQAAGALDATAREPVLESGGSNAGVVVQDKAGEAVPVVSEIGETAQTHASQQTSSENPNSDDLGNGQPAATAAAPGMAGRGAIDSPPEGTPAVAPGTSVAQAEGQVQVKTVSSEEVERVTKTQSEVVVDAPSSAESVSEPTSTQANTTSSMESGSLKSPVQSVGEQILDSVQASMTHGDRQISIRLDPPELGNVTVRFQEQDGQIAGVLEVSKDQTRQEVEQVLPQVVRSLQEAGVLVRRLDVVVADQSDRNLDREPLSRDAWGQQEGSGQHDSQAGESPTGRWSTWGAATQSSLEADETGQGNFGAGRNRIDMLI